MNYFQACYLKVSEELWECGQINEWIHAQTMQPKQPRNFTQAWGTNAWFWSHERNFSVRNLSCRRVPPVHYDEETFLASYLVFVCFQSVKTIRCVQLNELLIFTKLVHVQLILEMAGVNDTNGTGGKKQSNKNKKNKPKSQPVNDQTKAININETTVQSKPTKPVNKQKVNSIAKNEAQSSTKNVPLDSTSSINEKQKLKGWSSRLLSIYVWGMSAIYFFAFASLFVQVRGKFLSWAWPYQQFVFAGLYGENGLLPLKYFAASQAGKNSSASFADLFKISPSFVWILCDYGLSLTSALESIAIVGALIAFLQLFIVSLRNASYYFLLFTLYYSVVNVSYPFSWQLTI